MEDIQRSEVQYRSRLDGRVDPGLSIEANGVFTDPEWQKVTSSDGVRCFVAGAKHPQGA
jgi:hypothetical protein